MLVLRWELGRSSVPLSGHSYYRRLRRPDDRDAVRLGSQQYNSVGRNQRLLAKYCVLFVLARAEKGLILQEGRLWASAHMALSVCLLGELISRIRSALSPRP
eukprot:3395432-Rhodomonas_salina.1